MDARTISILECLEYNYRYDHGEFHGSEATKKNIVAIEYFVGLRDQQGYQYTDEYTEGNWVRLDITMGGHTKYGWNYIYLDHDRKLYRTRETPGEFYNH